MVAIYCFYTLLFNLLVSHDIVFITHPKYSIFSNYGF